MVQVNDAGVASVPAALTARTRNVWLPSASAVYAWGLVQTAKAPASSAHSNVAPAGFDVKLKLALVLDVDAGGDDVIVVSGGTGAVIVQVKDAGVGSVPAALTARTWNVWVPSRQ